MSELYALVAEELSLPVDPRVGACAAAIAAKHGAASRAVLFYGSCLRQKQLDGLMLDFYLIVSDYREAYAKSIADPEFAENGKKISDDFVPFTATDVEILIKRLGSLPPEATEYMTTILRKQGLQVE